MNLPENIKNNRKEMNLTQEQLAEAMDVTVGAVSKWESGTSTPDLNTLVALADFFQTSLLQLLSTIALNSEVASRIFSAEQIADTTATPSVPAAMTSPIVEAFMPPIATVGWTDISTALRSPSRPKGSAVSVLVGVPYTGDIPI